MLQTHLIVTGQNHAGITAVSDLLSVLLTTKKANEKKIRKCFNPSHVESEGLIAAASCALLHKLAVHCSPSAPPVLAYFVLCPMTVSLLARNITVSTCLEEDLCLALLQHCCSLNLKCSKSLSAFGKTRGVAEHTMIFWTC